MPGGKGKIKPEDGKQFSSIYQPQEKWTEKKAIELGNEMIDWLNELDADNNDSGNILFEEFLVIKKNLYPNVMNYLNKKFSSFSRLYAHAKKIQEVKITKYGLADRLNVSMAKFILAANHGLSDKPKDEVDDKDVTITLNFGGAVDMNDYRDDSKE